MSNPDCQKSPDEAGEVDVAGETDEAGETDKAGETDEAAEKDEAGDASNPFSTRYTRPGALEFDATDGPEPDELLRRLGDQDWWGEIVGPHGSGKTTLLEALQPRLIDSGRHVVRFSLRQGQRTLSLSSRLMASWQAPAQLVVDGYEQLRWWRRWRLQFACRRRRIGLLVTTHRPLGLPLLARTAPTPVLMRRLVRRLWPEHDRLIGDREIDACFERHGRNVRETMFSLYDLFQQRTGPVS